ncbi:MAG: DUF115 domain-containing protein [Phycisphaerales bacterium]|nr:DUF115 domain-containing protein [Phycisphaerales bacterium]
MDYSQLNALFVEDTKKNADNSKVVASNSDFGADDSILRKNLQALAICSPLAANQVAHATENRLAEFISTDEGILGLELDGIAMASKRKPMQEAKRFAERYDPSKIACVAISGFGIGYHCGTLLERLGNCGIVVCFEPDIELLRSVLSRVDYSTMFETRRVFILTQSNDSATLSKIFQGIEAVVGLGAEIVNHPPSQKRLGKESAEFGRTFSDILSATRTHVITTLANARTSFRNALMNLDHYSSTAGVAPLKDTCVGKPAVVVSAGPSLSRNLDLLTDSTLRESVVVIAVQTVLKQMLKKGIKPDFVAALDYHEISKRFYEGLTESDVEGIRLVVEAKANPAILDAFPGEVLCVTDELLDDVLGEDLERDLGTLTMGGTVAHLCYYFARYLGCDPVIFIGQDLGFTDGQYYSAGAAIHQVWSGELNAHNTLEMMEWQRIVRMRGLLRKKKDVHNKDIYLDEQMATYLAQFESGFQSDEEAGLKVIDATEGGVLKSHTITMTLKDAIQSYGSSSKIELVDTESYRFDDENRKKKIHERINSIIEDAKLISYLSNQSVELLQKMIQNHSNQNRVNELIHEVQGIRDRVVKMGVAFKLCESVNQVGVLNRMRQDRTIELNPGASAIERQRMQIERDIQNVEWTRDAADAVVEQLCAGRDAFLGLVEKQTNERGEEDGVGSTETRELQIETKTQQCIHGVIIADPNIGGLGTKRDLRSIITGGMNVLQLTIARLDHSEQLDAITIVTPDPDAIKQVLGSFTPRKKMSIVQVDPNTFGQHAQRVGSARMQSSECWRGSIGMLSVYDELFHPVLMSKVFDEHGIDACAIVGADWAMVDPKLVDQTVSRYRHQDSEKRIAFSQAVPGIGTLVVDRGTVQALADSMINAHEQANHFATLGTLVGYVPIAPQFDPIGKGVCIEIDHELRDAGVRVIADSTIRCAAMKDAYDNLNSDHNTHQADSLICVRAYCIAHRKLNRICPRTVVLETCTGRLASGDWGIWKRNSIEPIERPVLSIADAHSFMHDIGQLREDTAIVFDGVGDPLMHSQAMSFVQLAKEDGVACVEMRTDLLRQGADARAMIESGLDILSVDVLSEDREAYSKLTSLDRFDDLYERIQSIFDAKRADINNRLWFVPRITKCDAVYEQVESFYDKWLMLCGSAVIDSLPQRISDQRIKPLPNPRDRQDQINRSTMYVRCDGMIVDRIGRLIGGENSPINAFREGIEQAYQRMCSKQRSSRVEVKSRNSSVLEDHAA